MFGSLSSQFLDHLRPLFFSSGHSSLICWSTLRKATSQTLCSLNWAELAIKKMCEISNTAEKTQHSLPGKIIFGLWKERAVAQELLAIYRMWQRNAFPYRGPRFVSFNSGQQSEHTHTLIFKRLYWECYISAKFYIITFKMKRKGMSMFAESNTLKSPFSYTSLHQEARHTCRALLLPLPYLEICRPSIHKCQIQQEVSNSFFLLFSLFSLPDFYGLPAICIPH